jgi:hypothetical protein
MGLKVTEIPFVGYPVSDKNGPENFMKAFLDSHQAPLIKKFPRCQESTG